MTEHDAEEILEFLRWLEDTYGPEEVLELMNATPAYLASRIQEFLQQKNQEEEES